MSSDTTTRRGGDSFDHLDTPTLDAESAGLLHAISEHGGYAFVGMAAQAAAGDSRAAEAAREMAWEQLHSGPWHSVLPVWRNAYSMACLRVADHHFAGGEFKEALRVLDMGLIMGGTLLRKDLDAAVEKVSTRARGDSRVSGSGCNGGSSKSESRLVDGELDKAEVRFVFIFIFIFFKNGFIYFEGNILEKEKFSAPKLKVPTCFIKLCSLYIIFLFSFPFSQFFLLFDNSQHQLIVLASFTHYFSLYY